MTKEQVLELFTKEDRKVLNEAKQIMEKIFSKLGGTSFEDRLVEYIGHCLFDGMDAIEALEIKIAEAEKSLQKWYKEGGNCRLSVS